MHPPLIRILSWTALLLGVAAGGPVATSTAATQVPALTGQVASTGVDDAGQTTIAALGFSSGAAPRPLRLATVPVNGSATVQLVARDAIEPQVAVAGNGARAVVWLDLGGLRCMLAGAGQPLRRCPALGASRTASKEPRVALMPDGRVVVTWVSGGGHVAVIDPQSGAVRHTRLSASTRVVPIPTSDGSLLVARWTSGPLARLVASSVGPTGQLSESQIATGVVRAPIATAGLGPAFVWQDAVAHSLVTSGPIVLERPIAGAWHAERVSTKPSDDGGGPTEPAFAVDAAGRQLVVWTEARVRPGTNGSGLRRSTVRTRVTPGPTAPLGPAHKTGPWEHGPSVVAAPEGGFELLTLRSHAFPIGWARVRADLLVRHVNIDGALSAPRRVASGATAAALASSVSTSVLVWTRGKREQVWLDRGDRAR
ncbi:MAG: hypothetical protein JHC95_07375 [Solirubrobacteraceae bacterium]|nr:hypothetical protein [Solirubrobacteraceae bacterium]